MNLCKEKFTSITGYNPKLYSSKILGEEQHYIYHHLVDMED